MYNLKALLNNKSPIFFLWALFLGVCLCACKEPHLDRILQSHFGEMPDGQPVEQFTLRNQQGMEVKIITYGAIITGIQVPDRNGEMGQVVIGNDSLEAYLGRFPAAAVIGRFANRIENAQFTLDGQTYQLTINNLDKHHIHGGDKGFAKQLWTAEILPEQDQAAGVKLTYFSRDGEAGYPGNLTASVTYILNDSNELILDYAASTDKPSIVNLTNHAYFDLSGKSDIANHLLRLNADQYTLTDSELIPTGVISSVRGTPLDFTAAMPIGARLQEIISPRPHLYDHNFVINRNGQQLVQAAEVYYPDNGRSMLVSTDLPGVQLYTGNKRGFCLETQHFPNAINLPHFPSPIVRPERPYKSRTIFAFSVR